MPRSFSFELNAHRALSMSPRRRNQPSRTEAMQTHSSLCRSPWSTSEPFSSTPLASSLVKSRLHTFVQTFCPHAHEIDWSRGIITRKLSDDRMLSWALAHYGSEPCFSIISTSCHIMIVTCYISFSTENNLQYLTEDSSTTQHAYHIKLQSWKVNSKTESCWMKPYKSTKSFVHWNRYCTWLHSKITQNDMACFTVTLFIDVGCICHATSVACYQLVQSILKIGFALAKLVG